MLPKMFPPEARPSSSKECVNTGIIEGIEVPMNRKGKVEGISVEGKDKIKTLLKFLLWVTVRAVKAQISS